MTPKQAQRLVGDFRTYLSTIRDAAVRCKGKAEVAVQCDADTDDEVRGLNLLFNGMVGVVKSADDMLGSLASLEAVLSATKAAAPKPEPAPKADAAQKS